MTIQRRLAKTILESILDGLEARAHYSSKSMLARHAGNATIVLGLHELTKRFESLLVRWKSSRAGLASGLNLCTYSYELNSLAENLKHHPIFPEDYVARIFQKFYRQKITCSNIDFGAWLKEAKTENEIEDIAVSQAILERYDEAVVTCQSLRDPYRQDHVRYIICIEHYRRHHIQKAQAVHSTLTERILTTSSGAQFALGICNYLPWSVYPYSDC